jgi:hypothetical protein
MGPAAENAEDVQNHCPNQLDADGRIRGSEVENALLFTGAVADPEWASHLLSMLWTSSS